MPIGIWDNFGSKNTYKEDGKYYHTCAHCGDKGFLEGHCINCGILEEERDLYKSMPRSDVIRIHNILASSNK